MIETLTFWMTVIGTMSGVASMVIAWIQWRESKRQASASATGGSRTGRRRPPVSRLEQRSQQPLRGVGLGVSYVVGLVAPPLNLFALTLLIKGDFTGSLAAALVLLNVVAVPNIIVLFDTADERGARTFFLLATVPFALLYGVAGVMA